MKYNREHLVKLLKLIKEVSGQKGNEWFHEQLAFMFGNNDLITDKSKLLSMENKLGLIQQYLNININNLIDYSPFDALSKEQLFRDNLEMMRYQQGTPNHKINFGEFTRYAHLQAEEMINYFLNKITGGQLDKVEMLIKKYSQNYNPKREPSEIHHINYTYKLSAVKSLIKISVKIYDRLWFINELRNELSHRNSFSMQKEEEVLNEFISKGYLNPNISIKELSKEDKNIYNKGKFIINKRKEDFFSIIEALEELKNSVLVALQTPSSF